jgi:hypothetical protein
MEKPGVCRICGNINCKKHSMLLSNVKRISEFSGSSPPEIFVGKWNYPNVYVGILSPQEYGNTEILSSQELWHKNRLSMPEIISLRSQLIYGRNQSNIRKVLCPENKTRFLSTMQEVAMTSKPISAEFKLERPVIEQNRENDGYTPTITNAAQVKSVRLEENPIIASKVDYLVNDTDARSTTAMLELEKSKTPTSTIIKILSAGLLGRATLRKLVPTRWAITAVDDSLSKNKLKRIRYFQEISEIQLFTAEYLGNHYEFLLLPDRFSFEVIEINKTSQGKDFWHDYESFFGRKNYAESVTGAYYANRLALCEHLEKIQRQCACIVFREVSEEYTQSMGVGVLRQISREAFSKAPEKFSTINEALERIQSRIKLPVTTFTNKSIILKNYGKQKRLSSF